MAAPNEKLPFQIDLTPSERAAMPRFGDSSRSFMSNALSIAEAQSGILPNSFSIDKFRANVESVKNIYPVRNGVETLLGRLKDSEFATGSGGYAAALLVYQYGKGHNIATGALEETLDDLGRRFVRKSRKKPSAT